MFDKDGTIKKKRAYLILENDDVFEGYSIGVTGTAVGELVFNTAIVGYQEVITDPSYAGQIVVFTAPHIGNTGCNAADIESNKLNLSAMVCRELPTKAFYWRSTKSLNAYLNDKGIVGIAGIDTRKLARKLRDVGSLKACVTTESLDIANATTLAKKYNRHNASDLLNEVCTQEVYTLNQTLTKGLHVVVYDFGIKQNIIRVLKDQNIRLTVVPAFTEALDVLSLKPSGVILSNGPGNPMQYTHQVKVIQTLLANNIPLFGICLGHQLLSLACGAELHKLKFGHHGINHPVKDLRTGKVFITSQNHQFAVSDVNLPSELSVTMRSLFDHSIQGIVHRTKIVAGVQGHPEGAPGPVDMLPELLSFVVNKL